jgi:hypothetical protein
MNSENPADHEKATKEYTLIAKDMHDLADTTAVSDDTYRAKTAKVVQKDVDTANALVQLRLTIGTWIALFRWPDPSYSISRSQCRTHARYTNAGVSVSDAKRRFTSAS